jgi:hypothetical protein
MSRRAQYVEAGYAPYRFISAGHFPRYANKSIQKLKTKRSKKLTSAHNIIVKFACALAIKCKFVLEKFLSSDAAESRISLVFYFFTTRR